MVGIERYMTDEEYKTLRTVTEARAILDLQHGRTNGVLAWAVLDTALSMGLRVSELVSLRVEDIDVKLPAVKVRRLKKRKRVVETLPMDKALVQHLKTYLQWRADRLSEGQTKWTDRTGPLFIGQRGPLTCRGAQQIFKASAKRAGLRQSLSIHGARHTHAMRLYASTKDLRLVQRRLGHSQPAVTANMYLDVSFESMKQAVDAMVEV